VKEYINPEIFANVSLIIIAIAFNILLVGIYLINRKFERLSEKNSRV